MKTLETLIIRDPLFTEWITDGIARGKLVTPARRGTMLDITSSATDGAPEITYDRDDNVVVHFVDTAIPTQLVEFFNIMV